MSPTVRIYAGFILLLTALVVSVFASGMSDSQSQLPAGQRHLLHVSPGGTWYPKVGADAPDNRYGATSNSAASMAVDGARLHSIYVGKSNPSCFVQIRTHDSAQVLWEWRPEFDITTSHDFHGAWLPDGFAVVITGSSAEVSLVWSQ